MAHAFEPDHRPHEDSRKTFMPQSTQAEMIRHVTQTLIDHVEELTALDQAIGDGDHGLNMRRGALAIQAKLGELAGQSLNDALRTMGMTCMSTIGGSSGPGFGP